MSKPKSGAEDYSPERNLRTEEGVLSMGATRAVVMTESAYVFLLQVIFENAPHIIKFAFYDMGYRAGQDFIGAQNQRIEDPEKAFRSFVEAYRQSGYGDLEVTRFDLDKPEAVIAGTDLFESSVAQKTDIYRTPRAVDHYSRGMFAGFMSNLLGREVVCEEIKCEFRGDDRCEFVILPFETTPPANEGIK